MEIIHKKNKLKKQVKVILLENGISSAYNKSDFNHFRKKTKNSFNPVFAIAEMFIREYYNSSDLKEYKY